MHRIIRLVDNKGVHFEASMNSSEFHSEYDFVNTPISCKYEYLKDPFGLKNKTEIIILFASAAIKSTCFTQEECGRFILDKTMTCYIFW